MDTVTNGGQRSTVSTLDSFLFKTLVSSSEGTPDHKLILSGGQDSIKSN